MKHLLLVGISVFALIACEPEEKATTADEAVTTDVAKEEVTPNLEEDIVVSELDQALQSDLRLAPERDVWRHPKETLEFFGVESDDTVVEIWPGGGWYTSILGPYLKQGGGKLIAAGFDPASSDYARTNTEKFVATFVEKPDAYGTVDLTIASSTAEGFAPAGSADVVLTFRNVHNWMKGGYAEKMFKDSFDALKPGGILGVVEHRLPSAQTQDPQAASGYVHEELVKQMAQEAGFEFVGASEINANPADTADHPYGVWTLPPSSRQPKEGEESASDFDAAKYQAIGESDRMTLKFVKPATAVATDIVE